MTSSTNYSDVNVRPRRYKGIRSSKKSILYSDYNADEDSKNGNLGHRSVSLTALPHNNSNVVSSSAAVITAGPLLEPRMAQLETLEAKMASIEVSLSTTQRRKNGKKNGNCLLTNSVKTSTFGGTSPPINILASVRPNTLTDTCRELEILRNALKDKENTIQNLQGQMNCCGKVTSLQPLDPSERRAAETRLQSLKQEEETRKSAIRKINQTLEQMDINETNIDIRIRQAELEYELGREELGLLGVREEMRTLLARLDAKPVPTLYSIVNLPGKYTLHSVQVEYDPKSPRFGAGNLENKIGLFVLWAADSSGLNKGDRILEVNGKLTLATSKEEMIRLLTVCPSKAEIVVFRVWIPPPSSEDLLRRENLRLTHRISYLEDQVSELLLLRENSLRSDKEMNHSKNPGESYQSDCLEVLKTTLETSLSTGVDVKPDISLFENPRENNTEYTKEKIVGNNIPINTTSANSYNVTLPHAQKCENGNSQLQQFRLLSLSEKLRSFPKKSEKEEFCSSLTKITRNKPSIECGGAKHKLGLPCNLKNSFYEENSYSLSDLERPNRKTSHYISRTVDYSSETSCPKFTYNKERKGKLVEDHFKEGLEIPKNEVQYTKPTPPKKPIRLSVSQNVSDLNMESDYYAKNTTRKVKRPQKGEAPKPPIFLEKKLGKDSEFAMSDSDTFRTSSRTDLFKSNLEEIDSNHANFRWVKSSRRSKSRSSEKWC